MALAASQEALLLCSYHLCDSAAKSLLVGLAVGKGFGLAVSLASHLLLPPALPQLIDRVCDTSRIKGSGEKGRTKKQKISYSCHG